MYRIKEPVEQPPYASITLKVPPH